MCAVRQTDAWAMNKDFDSTERTSGEYAMFALGFIGFMVAAAGVVLSDSTCSAWCFAPDYRGLFFSFFSVALATGRMTP